MFPAIAPAPIHDSYVGVHRIATHPQNVRLAIRGWAAVCLASPGADRLEQLAPLCEIVAAIDQFVWRYAPACGGPRHWSASERCESPTDPLIDDAACGHSERVARFSTRLAKTLGWNSDELTTIYMAGLLHDVGKVGIDARILHKPHDLTALEYALIKTHPEFGHAMLAGIESLADVLPAVLHHHEHWDGRGYPHGLAGRQIPEIARIVAVADAYDAMTSDRPYRNGMPSSRVRRVLAQGAGVHWDPAVVDAYVRSDRELDRLSRAARRS